MPGSESGLESGHVLRRAVEAVLAREWEVEGLMLEVEGLMLEVEGLIESVFRKLRDSF